MTKLTTKNNRENILADKTSRDLTAWEAIRGIWKDKKIENPVEWQRKIRKAWERKSPQFN